MHINQVLDTDFASISVDTDKYPGLNCMHQFPISGENG